MDRAWTAHKSAIRASIHPAPVDDIRLGLAFRAARIRRPPRQQDLAQMAGVSDSLVSRLDHGEFAPLSVGAVRAIAARLGIRLDLVARWLAATSIDSRVLGTPLSAKALPPGFPASRAGT